MDAFCFDWAGENNWLVPRVIKHLFVCRSMGTLIVPKWVSAPFWPMLFGPHSPFSVCVKETIVFTNVSNIFVPGSTESIFDGPNFSFMYSPSVCRLVRFVLLGLVSFPQLREVIV